MSRLPPHSELLSLVDYNPETGSITWRERGITGWDRRFAGRPAFNCKSNGYLVGVIKGVRSIGAHRVAFKYVHGYDPIEVDHVNGDRTDNRIVNLREVTPAENRKNAARPSRNKSGFIGVDYRASKRKWRATITVEGKSLHLGYFSNQEDAIAARMAAQAAHGFHENHGRALCQ